MIQTEPEHATACQDLEVLDQIIQAKDCELATLRRLQESLALEIHEYRQARQPAAGPQPISYPE